MNAKELVEYIAKALVDHPDQVKVSEIEGEKTSVIELSVAKEDLGKVIGKQGRTARAMRIILSAASAKMGKRSILEILEWERKRGAYDTCLAPPRDGVFRSMGPKGKNRISIGRIARAHGLRGEIL